MPTTKAETISADLQARNSGPGDVQTFLERCRISEIALSTLCPDLFRASTASYQSQSTHKGMDPRDGKILIEPEQIVP